MAENTTTAADGAASVASQTPTMSWEPIRKRLLGSDLQDALSAAQSIRNNVGKLVQQPSEFALLLSALLPAFSSLLTSICRPTAQGPNQQLRYALLDIISKFPCNEILRPHAPHLILVAMNVLDRDFEENALLASQIIFDLYKTYRTLPQDHVQPFLDFVIHVYKALPSSVKRNLSAAGLRPEDYSSRASEAATSVAPMAPPPVASTQPAAGAAAQPAPGAVPPPAASVESQAAAQPPVVSQGTPQTVSSSTSAPKTEKESESAKDSSSVDSGTVRKSLLPSKISFRVLTECPLTVMLMFQLYPAFVQKNVSRIIKVMLDALGLRAPLLNTIMTNPDKLVRRLYYMRLRELVAAQAKTLSFVTMLLKSFTQQLSPYQDKLAQNVVDLFRSCPPESFGTRKELIVATRHLFNSDLRPAFVRHVDVLLDERLFLGQHHRQHMSTMLRTMGYQTLSELVQHVRNALNMSQATRIVGTFARVLHDRIPTGSQYSAIRILLSLGEIVYRNKDPNPQTGRDLLVRIITSLTSKLEAIYAQEDWEAKAASDDFKDAEVVRDAQSLVRFIIAGSKNIVHFLADYRNQREKVAREMAMPPPGSNEEVASAYHKLTQTEVALVNRYFLAAVPALDLLKLQTVHHSSGALTSGSASRTSDQFRDALTYFAATFAILDGHYLRRTVGRNFDMLFEAIVDDNMVLIIPRHLLSVNANTSFEFCAILVPFLMKRLGDLRGNARQSGIRFVDAVEGDRKDCREVLLAQCEGSAEPDKRLRDVSQALLQLFERVLKSLNTYPGNESLIRGHLRPIVATCLARCMENTNAWPDDYCMLLRYVFRSISAGKFEDSYRELLPLIPTVLNGLYRVICVSEHTLLRQTAMEICLTIPARLSSLLPHMNLLLRVIIPALDSGSGDLVNLGLRTLEFWVDNLNQSFLYPEMSKETPVLSHLMQALSCHLRPAPYPYGLLTLRLLGKLGGKNRQFLRDPLLLTDRPRNLQVSELTVGCSWRSQRDDAAPSLPLPVESCLEILKLLAITAGNKPTDTAKDDDEEDSGDDEQKEHISWDEYDLLWTNNLEKVDFESYARDVREKTRHSQAVAALVVVKTALSAVQEKEFNPVALASAAKKDTGDTTSTNHQVTLAILFACCIKSVKQEAFEVLWKAVEVLPFRILCEAVVEFVSEPLDEAFNVVVSFYKHVLNSKFEQFDSKDFWLTSVRSLCSCCCSASWERQAGVQEALCFLIESLGREWAFEHEMTIINASMVALKSVPRELAVAGAESMSFFVRVCGLLYGKPASVDTAHAPVLWDILSGYDESKENNDLSGKDSSSSDKEADKAGAESKDSSPGKETTTEMADTATGDTGNTPGTSPSPSEEVVVLAIRGLVSTQHLTRFASRFFLSQYNATRSLADFKKKHLELVKRILFLRSMKLLPLPNQVGAAEGLTFIVTRYPGLLPLTDQHLLAFLSELLKMSSVADGEMTDPNLSDYVVDKNGFCVTSDDRHQSITEPSHSSGIFFRRECIIGVDGFRLHLPAEMPPGVQLRVSAIKLLHTIIRNQPDSFFEADNSTPIGNIRPHVISLLFRSLVSRPNKAVFAAHLALQDVLSLSLPKGDVKDSGQNPSRLPKELLQTCIRPVLLNLRDYQRLSVPLLRGLSKLLSLLSSWFNKTLGEKLLDHLQKWMDPGKILSLKLWPVGEEPAVAAAIVEIFSLLPHASNFVEPLVKTCMKLEASLPALKIRLVNSPYRQPLARYLSKHPASTVNFFFKRLPTPMYSELFQWLVRCEESAELRKYLATKPCSMMILNHCFEKPLGIIRAEKDSPSNPLSSRELLAQHGIGIGVQKADSSISARMSIGALELQLQGFILISTLMTSDRNYIKEQGDIVRAFRWLWRSRGRVLRFKHENGVPPRFHSESRMLASFLVSYAKFYPSEGLDILFELVSAFSQPATVDFSFLVKALHELATTILPFDLKERVLERFFELVSRDKSEEMKVLSIQYLVYPMLSFSPAETSKDDRVLIDETVVSRFVKEVLFQKGTTIVCAERLKVELLRLTDLMLKKKDHLLAPFQKEIVQFCLVLLKNDDLSCKGWAYVVLARVISTYDTEENLIFQVYASLLRTHQQEIKDMVRQALDLLVPALPKRLGEAKTIEAVKKAATVMVEDGSSSPQLAHICSTVVANPTIFFSQRVFLAKQFTGSLNRLGLPSAPSLESRVLSVDVIELLLDWEGKHENSSVLLAVEQLDVMANFLVRSKILMAEPHDSRGSRIEMSSPLLEKRIMGLIEVLIQRPGVEIRKQPFEGISGREKQSAASLMSCIDLFYCFSKVGKVGFFHTNATLTTGLVQGSFVAAASDLQLRKRLRSFLTGSMDVHAIVASSLVALERIISNATKEQRKSSQSRSAESRASISRSPRPKEKVKSSDPGEVSAGFAYYSIRLALDLGNHRQIHLRRITSALLDFADVLAKNHLLDAAAKQRQGAATGPPNTSPGMLHHTPTRGIIEEASLRDRTDASRLAQLRPKTGKDGEAAEQWIKCLVATLNVFENSLLPFSFTQDRKSLLQILSSILDSSDNVQLLMVATRIIGKWLLSESKGGPLTLKERNSFLWKIASFDFNGLADDLSAQPLADLVAYFVEKAKGSVDDGVGVVGEGIVIGRSLVACLLHARGEVRNRLFSSYLSGATTSGITTDASLTGGCEVVETFWRLLHSDVEGLASRSWIALFVDGFLMSLSTKHGPCVDSLRALAHGDVMLCQRLFEWMLPYVWQQIPNNHTRLRLANAIEGFLARPFHSQFQKSSSFAAPRERRCSNAIRSFLSGIALIKPLPVLDPHQAVALAENYTCWYEVVALLEKQYVDLQTIPQSKGILDALRHCYRQLGEDELCVCLAKESCELTQTKSALVFDVYGMVDEAMAAYENLVGEVEAPDSKSGATDFEMDLWEERWVGIQREVCQLNVVSEFANSAGSLRLRLECAWKSQDWHTVRSLCTSASLLAAVESGDPIVKISETLLAVVDGKLSEVENLHAQTAQLCLHKWQLLPRLSNGSLPHESLLHYFHRLVEIRESGQIMVETSNHSKVKTLPDLKNLLNAWRQRLPNVWESMTMWDDVFAWRAHMFTAINKNFGWSGDNTVATLHDMPWTAIRMAKTARKHGMRDVSMLLLNKAVDECAMNILDAFQKLREKILTYFNKSSDKERQGGLNLINATKLVYFDHPQKSELFRLKASFLASLGHRSKANQAFCHSLQICPTHSRAWESWGGLCSALGDVAEKQVEEARQEAAKDPTKKESVAQASKRVAQYLAQAMGCYLEAIQIDANEWNRIHLPKCIWMLTKDGGSPGILHSTFENRGSPLPAWVWLPWLPQLFTGLYREEGRAVRTIFARILKSYPQAVYYPLRAFFLERRDVERAKSSSASSNQLTGSAGYAEEMVSQLRRLHTSLWSSLESILEELLVKFRPAHEEEFLATIVALLERAEAQVTSIKTKEEDAVTSSVWKTLGRIAVKYFRHSDTGSQRKDERAIKTVEFKNQYRESFEKDFHVSSSEATENEKKSPLSLDEILSLIRLWKKKLEEHVFGAPHSVPLSEASRSLAMYCLGDSPDLWPGSCDPRYASPIGSEHDHGFGKDQGPGQSTTSSVQAAKKAAMSAAKGAAVAATREGVGGDYGGGSSFIEIPGQYMPNTTCWADVRPSPELHPKLMRFEPNVKVLKRNDQLVRRIGMIGSDGIVYRFLLQCALPYWTRTDERTAQTHYVLDKVLRKSVKTARAHMSVQPSQVIPVAQRLRLVVESRSQRSLEEIVDGHLSPSGRDLSSFSRTFQDGVKSILSDDSFTQLDSAQKSTEETARRVDLFRRTANENPVPDHVLSQYLHRVLESPEPYYQFRRMFSMQWAANCLLQYAFHVVERTPARVILMENDGRVLAPDFRIQYNSQGQLETQQQAVPFRLTPNLMKLIGFLLLDGRFISSMVRIATVMSESQQVNDLDPVWRLLMRDDLTAYFTKSMAKPDAKTQEMERQLADRVSQNVATVQKHFRELALGDCGEQLVDYKVRSLVESAQAEDKLAMMTGNFLGWI